MLQERDTIPRLHRVLEHIQDQLIGFADGGDTFEAARLRYGMTQERLARSGRGRMTASRVSEVERNWAPTRDVLSELIRLKAVAPQRLPSARKFLEAHRANRYTLTAYGAALASAACDDKVSFVDQLTEGLIQAHPYLRALLLALNEGPIVCPVISEGDVERGREARLGSHGWAEDIVERIGDGVGVDQVSRVIREHLRRRFGAHPPERPSNKAISEVMNDAFAVAGFRARNLDLDANTIKTLVRWGTDLLLYDQSRYVPRFGDANVIWLASDVDVVAGTARTRRRGRTRYGQTVARALVAAYWEQAAHAATMLTSPYIPIHRVRAQAAFETHTMRRLGDAVLSGLVDEQEPEIGVTVAVHIGTSQLPMSEPPFRHHGRRRLEMTIAPSPGSRRA